MILKPAPISTERLTFDGCSKFTAEISDFGPGFRLGQVYDDACDVGLTLVSHRTGNEVVFAVEHTETREGDVLWWILRAVTCGHKNLTIQLFND